MRPGRGKLDEWHGNSSSKSLRGLLPQRAVRARLPGGLLHRRLQPHCIAFRWCQFAADNYVIITFHNHNGHDDPPPLRSRLVARLNNMTPDEIPAWRGEKMPFPERQLNVLTLCRNSWYQLKMKSPPPFFSSCSAPALVCILLHLVYRCVSDQAENHTVFLFDSRTHDETIHHCIFRFGISLSLIAAKMSRCESESLF